MMRALVLGFGNLDRQDDGVAYDVINGLRHRLGKEPLDEGAMGPEEIVAGIDAVFVRQLEPGLMDLAAGYDRVVFVDAHVQPDLEGVSRTQVQPELTVSAFTHHMTPQTFLAWLGVLHRRRPAGFIVSVRGHSFDFGRGLSQSTATQVAPAVEHVLHLLPQGQTRRNQAN
ncbi:MAG: hydrogenase maturation protease [Anaerolineae bacterium]|jgi:hydrogenase maturation protease